MIPEMSNPPSPHDGAGPADVVLTRAADELERLLRQAAQRLRPFPPFPGALFTYGVEVEPTGLLASDLGCIIVTEEGDLKELLVGLGEGPMFGPPDPVALREERLVDVDLTPHDRLLFTCHGLLIITALLLKQEAEG